MLQCGSIYSHTPSPLKALSFLIFLLVLLPGSLRCEPAPGIAMHGKPAEPAGFTHFPYANPDAPKGGRLTLAKRGSFDSLNPLIVKGESAEGIREYVYESLLARAYDEPFTLYGLIAEKVETPEDRSFVEFTLNPEAKFSDGTPITVDDVIFSHALLRDHGRPNHRSYYQKVTRVEKTGDRKVKFTFDGSGDREMPLIMGLMPVLPRHLIDPETFEKTSFVPPIGSGPYLVGEVKPGTRITFKRDPNYWGAKLPVNKGQFNFDEIRFDYYRDAGSMFEAFKAGAIDARPEDDPTRWTEGYNIPPVRDGRIVKEEFPVEDPAGMSALVFNTRRPLFADSRVRQALIKLFDFEWINRTLYHGQYARSESYFARSELTSHGRAADEREKALLAPLRERGEAQDHGRHLRLSGQRRLRREPRGTQRGAGAARTRPAIGWRMASSATRPARPSASRSSPPPEPRNGCCSPMPAPCRRWASRRASARSNSAQYQRRKQTYDFDMIQYDWPVSLSPGNEQSFRWGSDAAATEGTYNYAG